MPINVFGNSNSKDNCNKIDTSLFVQKPYLRTIYIEINIEEDIDLKNQYRIKNLSHHFSSREAASKNYVDNKFNDPSIIKSNNRDKDLKYKNIINVGLIEVNRPLEYGDQVPSKFYVDNTIRNNVAESTLLRLDPDEKLNLVEKDSIILNSTLTSPKTIIEVPTKNYIDKKFDDPSIIKNTTHVDFKDKNLDNVRFIKVNSFPAFPEHLTAKIYIDKAISYSVDEPSLIRLDPAEKLNPNEQCSIILKSTLTSPKTIIELPTKSYVDSSHESSRNRGDLSSVFNDQNNEFDRIKLTNLDSFTVYRNPTLDTELSCKKYVDGSIGEGTLLRFIKTLTNYLKVSVGIDFYSLTNYDRIKIIDTTIINYPNTADIIQVSNITFITDFQF